MKHVYFVRHGQSVMNDVGLWAGSTETPLTATGRKQAESAGEYAKRHDISLIISSPLERAHDTAQIIAAAIGYPVEDILINQLLTERHFGVLEGTPYDPAKVHDDVEGVETLDQLRERVTKFWEYLQSLTDETVLVVSHGSTGRMLRHTIHPEIPFWSPDPELHQSLKLPNAKIIQLL